jgi:hypothetical protein
MHSNIIKKKISWNELKEEKITLNMLEVYKQRDDLPLNVQDAIMKELVCKILLNLNEKDKIEF